MPQTKGNCAPTFSDKASKCAPSFCQCIKGRIQCGNYFFVLIAPGECFYVTLHGTEWYQFSSRVSSSPSLPFMVIHIFQISLSNKSWTTSSFQFSTCPSGLKYSQWPSFRDLKTYFRLIPICLQMMLPPANSKGCQPYYIFEAKSML